MTNIVFSSSRFYFVSRDASGAEETRLLFDFLSDLFDEIGAQDDIVVAFVFRRLIFQPDAQPFFSFLFGFRGETGQMRRGKIIDGERRSRLFQPLNVFSQIQIRFVDTRFLDQFVIGVQNAKDIGTGVSISEENLRRRSISRRNELTSLDSLCRSLLGRERHEIRDTVLSPVHHASLKAGEGRLLRRLRLHSPRLTPKPRAS